MTCLTLAPTTLFILTYPPTLASQGLAHRIFYIHVPIAWVALYAPFFAAISSILYLYKNSIRYHIYSLANMKLAFVFSLCVVISGPIWAQTEWGTYWNWKDPRLISFAILLFMLSVYFITLQLSENLEQQARVGAVITILSALVAVSNLVFHPSSRNRHSSWSCFRYDESAYTSGVFGFQF